MNAVNWFEVPVNDLDRAKKFYSDIFGGIDFQHNDMGGAVMAMFPWDHEAPGAAGALIKSEGYVPSMEGSVVYFFAGEDLSPVLKRVEEAGGKVLVPKMSIGEHGFIAHIVDSEGNRVALHSRG